MKKLSLIAFLVLIFSALNIFSAPFKNIERILVQPNGETLVCYASGDEFYNRLHDKNGFTIVQNENGYFVYADLNTDNQIIATEYIAGKVDPVSVGLQPGIRISHEEFQKKYEAMHLDEFFEMKRNMRDGETNHGIFSNLTVFIRFNGDENIKTTASTINAMFNGNTDEDESMGKFFKQFSYNQLFINSYFYPEPDGELVLSYEDIHPRNYYRPYNATTNPIGYQPEERAVREFDLLERAIEYVKPMIPNDLDIDCNKDGIVDNMVFVVKGNVGDWADLLWPHQWWFYERQIFINGAQVMNFNFQLESASTYFTVSTLCHEMFHSLGAPDLYHYDDPYGLDPAGSWDLMCGDSNPPQSSCVWMKYRYGNWIDDLPIVSDYGTYTIEANTWEGGRRNGILIETSHPKQYYLVQFRDKDNFYDKGVPGKGITVSRIDKRYNGGAGFNGHDNFDEVYVFQPNGGQYTQGALASAFFSEKAGRTEFNCNTPAKPWLTGGTIDEEFNICNIKTIGHQMQFTYCPINHQIVPKNLTVNVVNHSQIDLKWDAVEDANYYKIYRDELLVANNVTETFYSETGEIGDGYHEYYVTSVTDVEESYNSEKQYVILGPLAEINLQMTAELEERWQGAEVELSFGNGMPTRHFTIYNGEDAEKSVKIIVPADTEVTATWYGGWDEEKCHFSLSDTHTSLTDNDFKDGENVKTFIAGENEVCAEPQNLTATIDMDNVVLNWTSFVETDEYVVMRDGEVLDTKAVSSFIDENVKNSGKKHYEVAPLNCESGWSSIDVFVMSYVSEAPQLAADYTKQKVELTWNAPAFGGELNYVNDEYVTSIGSNSANWAVRFTPEMMQLFEGQKLSALEMWDAAEATYTFKIYNGETTTADNLIHTEEVEMTGSGQWVKFDLSENVAFSKDEMLWITVKSKGSQNPAPVCQFVGNDNSALMKSGSTWRPLADYHMDYSWMLRAYTNAPEEIQNEMSYNIYRNGDVIATDVKSTDYTDTLVSEQKYCYTVSMVLDGNEYEPSNEVCCDLNINEIAENVNFIYPNPAENVININAEIDYCEVYDVTGRKIITATEPTISVKEWKSGVYTVKIFTREGNILTEKLLKK